MRVEEAEESRLGNGVELTEAWCTGRADGKRTVEAAKQLKRPALELAVVQRGLLRSYPPPTQGRRRRPEKLCARRP